MIQINLEKGVHQKAQTAIKAGRKLGSRSERFWVLTILSLVLWSAGAADRAQAWAAQTPELVIYTYQSWIAPGGLGPEIFPLFEKRYQCRIKALASGDGGQLISRLQWDSQRGKPTAHLLVGMDQPLWDRAKPYLEGWGSWVPEGEAELKPEFRRGGAFSANGILPYDYGALSWIVDRSAAQGQLRMKLQDLLQPRWKRNLILEDPRTSSPGLSFLLFTKIVLGKSVWNFWKQFRGQWMTLSPGWSQAYQLFLRGEAPWVWSYFSSQAYQEEHGDVAGSKRRYSAVIFEEGQPLQVEGAALVRGAFKSEEERKLARKFLEFLISPEVQNKIPHKNWMMPVRAGIDLPPSFSRLPKPLKSISLAMPIQEVEETLAQWGALVAE